MYMQLNIHIDMVLVSNNLWTAQNTWYALAQHTTNHAVYKTVQAFAAQGVHALHDVFKRTLDKILFFYSCQVSVLFFLFFFRFSSATPGVVYVKKHAGSYCPERAIMLLKDATTLPPKDLPAPVPPPGLSEARSKYLYESIREYCSAATQDITCPEPST